MIPGTADAGRRQETGQLQHLKQWANGADLVALGVEPVVRRNAVAQVVLIRVPKIFQIGEDSTLGITMWGLGNLAGSSYRTVIARFSDLLVAQPAQSIADVADRWNTFFCMAYSTEFAIILQRVQQLKGQAKRTSTEADELRQLKHGFSGGFCVGGHLLHDRSPQAFEMQYAPDLTAPAPVQPLRVGTPRFWGVPNLMERLLYGVDEGVVEAILQSGKMERDIERPILPDPTVFHGPAASPADSGSN